MKKRVFALALAVLVFGLTACAPQADDGGVTTTTAEQITTTTTVGSDETTTTAMGTTAKPTTTTGTVLSPASLRCYSIGEERDLQLSADEKAYIVSAINSLSWKTDHYKCASGYIFYYDGKELYYHESCGSVNDNINKKAAKFSDEQVKAIDAILDIGNTTTTKKPTTIPTVVDSAQALFEDCTYDIVDGGVHIRAAKKSMAGRLVIPSTVDGYPVTAIDEFAFADCDKLTGVTIPDSVTVIGKGAFSGCVALQSILLPRSITTLPPSLFSGCSGLTDVKLPDTLLCISDSAFSGCRGLVDIDIPYSVTEIGERAFAGCSSLDSLSISCYITAIRRETFVGCTKIRYVSLYNTVTKIEENAFKDCTNLSRVNYVGKEEEWEKIEIQPNGNQKLLEAERLYKRK